jgi:hypothetical protein
MFIQGRKNGRDWLPAGRRTANAQRRQLVLKMLAEI